MRTLLLSVRTPRGDVHTQITLDGEVSARCRPALTVRVRLVRRCGTSLNGTDRRSHHEQETAIGDYIQPARRACLPSRLVPRSGAGLPSQRCFAA